MVLSSSLSLFLLLLSAFVDLSHSTPQATALVAKSEYLKLPLLHRSPLPSPFAVLSSDSRRLSFLHQRNSSVKSPVISGASSGSGQYFVSLRLGTPPQTFLLVADTGSDLTWVRCSACSANCSTFHPPGSTFLPRLSTTFTTFHCYSRHCRLVPNPDPNPCNRTRLHSPCRYDYSYSDGSLSRGFFSRETTILQTSSGRVRKLKNLSFGCGFQVSGPSVTGASFNGANGVMGLGRAPISFSSQLGRRYGNKFSYCLMDYTLSPPPTSYLMIGDDAVSSNRNKTVNLNFTPLLVNPFSPTFYYIGIESAFVDGGKLRINPSVWSMDDTGNGGTVLDSGTTLTFLAEPAYRQILKALKRRVKLPRPDKPVPGFDLCMNVSDEARPKLPRLSFKLVGGSLFSPPPGNYFIQVRERVKCLAIQPVDSATGFSVIGNLMQQGFLLEFDRDRSRLGFSRRGCALP